LKDPSLQHTARGIRQTMGSDDTWSSSYDGTTTESEAFATALLIETRHILPINLKALLVKV